MSTNFRMSGPTAPTEPVTFRYTKKRARQHPVTRVPTARGRQQTLSTQDCTGRQMQGKNTNG
jgi:hypothetical protein